MGTKIWSVILLGILIRFVVSPFTYHSDIQPFDLGGYVISQGYILNFYDFFSNINPQSQIVKTFHDYNFNYPPMVYFFLGILSSIFSIFVGNDFRYNFLFDVKSTLGTPMLFFHLLTLKLPYFVFDIACVLILVKLFDSLKQRLIIVSMWMFNPVSIYSSYLMGQFDIIPTFFTLLSLYFIRSAKNEIEEKSLMFSALSLGFGAVFKIYPLFLLVPLVSLAHNWKTRFKIFIVALIPYLLFILPFLPSQGFRSSALVAGQTLKSLYAQIPISGGEAIIIFLATIVFLYLVFLRFKVEANLLWERYLIVLLVFFIFTHYHPQWFLWLTPFLLIEAVKSGLKNILAKVLIYLSWFSLLFFFDPGITIGLFSPIFPALYDTQSIWQLLHLNVDYNFWRSIFQTIFVGSALYYLYLYFPRQEKSNF